MNRGNLFLIMVAMESKKNGAFAVSVTTVVKGKNLSVYFIP